MSIVHRVCPLITRIQILIAHVLGAPSVLETSAKRRLHTFNTFTITLSINHQRDHHLDRHQRTLNHGVCASSSICPFHGHQNHPKDLTSAPPSIPQLALEIHQHLLRIKDQISRDHAHQIAPCVPIRLPPKLHAAAVRSPETRPRHSDAAPPRRRRPSGRNPCRHQSGLQPGDPRRWGHAAVRAEFPERDVHAHGPRHRDYCGGGKGATPEWVELQTYGDESVGGGRGELGGEFGDYVWVFCHQS